MISSIVFVALLGGASWLFARNFGRVRRNILLGRDVTINDRPAERWALMARVALGQSKMVVRPVAGLLHIIVYAGFVIINIEVLEILIDGIFGTHRVLSFLGGFYDFLIGSFEWLALGVLVACVIFLVRRHVIKLKRFVMKDLDGWPRTDADLILVTEILLMGAFLLMNAADLTLQQQGAAHYAQAGTFPVSSALAQLAGLSTWQPANLVLVERACWWFHIIGILAFLNYLVISKHLHILLAFPNVWYSKLAPRGQIPAMESVTTEIKAMMDPSFVPDPNAVPPARFGAKDVHDLHFANLLNAYSCTECGRCTSECPANQTGKKLSPRRIMMATRDRVEEVLAGGDSATQKTLLDDWITREELWACTTCNACVEACPVNIDPLDVILQMRQYLVMEESAAPSTVNVAMGNIENNAAPWAYPQADRGNWINS